MRLFDLYIIGWGGMMGIRSQHYVVSLKRRMLLRDGSIRTKFHFHRGIRDELKEVMDMSIEKYHRSLCHIGRICKRDDGLNYQRKLNYRCLI